MGKIVFMTFAHEKKKNVQVITVSEEATKEKVSLAPAEPKPASTWMKSKRKTRRN